jgi:hypothetical protein
VLLCRSLERAEKAAQDIRLQTEGEVLVEQLDLGKPKLPPKPKTMDYLTITKAQCRHLKKFTGKGALRHMFY